MPAGPGEKPENYEYNALFVYKGDFFIIITAIDADRWQSGLMHRS